MFELDLTQPELEEYERMNQKKASELIIANKELMKQNIEKEKLTSKLIIANKKLLLQYINSANRISIVVSLVNAILLIALIFTIFQTASLFEVQVRKLKTNSPKQKTLRFLSLRVHNIVSFFILI